MNIVEIFGYAASAFVAASFFFSSVLTLRIVNTIGCVLFIAYGVMLGSIPIIITNAIITAVNVYQLSKSKFKKAK